jgi:hypothetical protein
METSRDRLYLEVECDQREDEALEVLDEVVEHPETLRIAAVLHVQQRSNLGTL